MEQPLVRAAAGEDGDLTRVVVDDLNARAWAERNGDAPRFLSLATEAHRIALGSGYVRGLAESLRSLGVCRIYASEHRKAIAFLTEALELNRVIHDPFLEIECLHTIALAHYGIADYESAMKFAQSALDGARGHGRHVSSIKISISISMIHTQRGDYQKAFDTYMDALHLSEKYHDPTTECLLHNNIAGIYEYIGSRELALDYYRRGMESSRNIGFYYAQALCSHNVTSNLIALDRISEATASNDMTYRIAVDQGFVYFQCASLVKKAKIEIIAGRTARALADLEDARAVSLDLDEPLLHLDLEMLSGSLLFKEGDIERAGAAFDRAVEMARELDSKPSLLEAYKESLVVAEKRRDFVRALYLHKQIYQLEKELYQESADKRAKALKFKQQVKEVQDETQELRHRVRQMSDSQASLARQVMQDPLTGLRNRRAMEQWLAEHFRAANLHGKRLVVVLSDIDHFKSINDRFSHQTGDDVLRRVAHIMQNACRSEDLAARYGGEEFLIALPDVDVLTASTICERIRREIDAYPWTMVHPDLHVTISLGIAADITVGTVEAMIAQADKQLYRAKREGRNRVCFTEPPSSNFTSLEQLTHRRR